MDFSVHLERNVRYLFKVGGKVTLYSSVILKMIFFFFGGGRGSNPGSCIFYVLSKPTELNSRRLENDFKQRLKADDVSIIKKANRWH